MDHFRCNRNPAKYSHKAGDGGPQCGIGGEEEADAEGAHDAQRQCDGSHHGVFKEADLAQHVRVPAHGPQRAEVLALGLQLEPAGDHGQHQADGHAGHAQDDAGQRDAGRGQAAEGAGTGGPGNVDQQGDQAAHGRAEDADGDGQGDGVELVGAQLAVGEGQRRIDRDEPFVVLRFLVDFLAVAQLLRREERGTGVEHQDRRRDDRGGRRSR